MQKQAADDATVSWDNTTPGGVPSSIPKGRSPAEARLAACEEELAKANEKIQEEKRAKRKLYTSLIKLANQLKKVQSTQDPLMAAANYANRTWYEGGMWRAPQTLPGVVSTEKERNQPTTTTRQPISLSELFFDLVIVMAFTRVGTAVSTRMRVDGPVLAYFAIFWTIWSKEASYSTRFDTTDLSAQVETLLTCFAVLFGSLSTANGFESEDATRMMVVAGFVAVLHFALHIRVAFWYRGARIGSGDEHVRNYAVYNIVMNMCEVITWSVGVFYLPHDSEYRWFVFLVGVLCALRWPRAFLANDFHGK